MKELKRIVADMESVFTQSSYPRDFLDDYVQMECLASHIGRETFLVQRVSDGQTAVATCYDRSAFPFRPDIRLLQSLKHPGLPRFYRQYQNEQMVCIVREYIEGEPLNVCARDRQMRLEEIIALARQLCDILKALHTHEPPVIHRDIKPENIIVKPDGSIALIDFDIARAVKDSAETDTVFFGTKGYAPPEQYGFGQTDARADIYAFGVLLRWMVTGSARKNDNIAIDEGLQRIIDRCTAFAPQQRYSDIGEVRQALDQARRHKRRIRPRTAAALALAAILLLATGFWVGRYTDVLRPEPVITFQEPLIERAARAWIGKESGALTSEDLARVTGIYIYGTQVFSGPEGFYRCDLADSSEGPIRTLDDLSLLPNLEELHIVHQGYVDTSGIAGHAKLRAVELKHMRLSSVAAIADAPGLRNVVLFYVGLSDVTALQNCPWLEELDVGYNDIASLAQVGSYPRLKRLNLAWLTLDDVDDIAERMPRLQVLSLHHASIQDLSGLKDLSELQIVYALHEQAPALNALFEGTDVRIDIVED